MLKKPRNIILLGLLLIVIGGMVWFLFIRDTEVEENIIAEPTLSVQGNINPCAAPNVQPDATLAPDATVPPTEPSVVAPPTVITGANEDNYQLFVFDRESDATIIQFQIVDTDISGTFEMFGHWFEFIYIPEEDGWCAVLWLDIDGNSVQAGNEVLNNLMIFAFQAERYPVGRFVGAATTLISDLSETNSVVMSGDIELSGVVQDLEVPITFSITGDQLTASAKFIINANDFGASLPGDGAELDSNIRVVANRTDPTTIEIPDLPTAVPSEPSE